MAILEGVWRLISLCAEVRLREFTNQTQWTIVDAGLQTRSLDSSLLPRLPEGKTSFVQLTSGNRELTPLATSGFSEVWLRCPIGPKKLSSCRATPAGARHTIGASETGISPDRLPPGRACRRFFRRPNSNAGRPNIQSLDIGVCLPKSIAMTEPSETDKSDSQHHIPPTAPTPNSPEIPHLATKSREEPKSCMGGSCKQDKACRQRQAEYGQCAFHKTISFRFQHLCYSRVRQVTRQSTLPRRSCDCSPQLNHETTTVATQEGWNSSRCGLVGMNRNSCSLRQ